MSDKWEYAWTTSQEEKRAAIAERVCNIQASHWVKLMRDIRGTQNCKELFGAYNVADDGSGEIANIIDRVSYESREQVNIKLFND